MSIAIRAITIVSTRKVLTLIPSIAHYQANPANITVRLPVDDTFDGATRVWIELHASQTSDPADVLTNEIIDAPTGTEVLFELPGSFFNQDVSGPLGEFWLESYVTWEDDDRLEQLFCGKLFLHRHNASETTPPPSAPVIPLTTITGDARYAQLTDLEDIDDRVSDLEAGGGGATGVTSLTIGGVAAAVGKLTALNVKAPVPVVIYFHGSGENEGTPFNGTGAPITSALMAAGCIVMSSSGGGVSQWGNTTEINAYKALVDYAVTNYNPSGIYFIGQSMGAIAALNLIAAGTVQCNGFWGVYPATNLSWAYANGFAAQIESAYGFSGSGNYAAATSGHDPYLITAASFAGAKFSFVASSSDTTISKTSNSDLFQTKLAAINLTSSVIQHTGNHGDSSAFIPASVVEFCDPMGQAYSGLIQRIGQSGDRASVLGIGGPTGSGAYIGTFQDRAIFGHNVCYDGTNWRQYDPTHASSMWLGNAGQMGWWAQTSGNPTNGLGTQWLTLQPGAMTWNGDMVVVGSLTVGAINPTTIGATTKTDQILLKNGSAASPSVRIGEGSSVNGWYSFAGIQLNAVVDGNNVGGFTSLGGFIIGQSVLYSGVAGVMQQRGDATQQEYQIFGTYTSPTAYERLSFKYDSGSGAFVIGTEKGVSGGSARNLQIRTNGSLRATFSASGVTADAFNGDYMVLSNTSYLQSTGSGRILLDSNSSPGNFDRLQFGGTAATRPALKQVNATLEVVLANDSGYTDVKLRHLIGTGVNVSGSYTVGTVPTASSYTGGRILVSNESGGAVLAFSDGTDWRRVTDRAIIS